MQSLKFNPRIFLLLMLAVFLVVPVSMQDDGAEETFTIAIGVSVRDLEPTVATGIIANMLDYVIETLVTTDDTGEILPGLAESWDVSEDGKSITFNLREGVTFHDGTPFNAEAMAFSLNRWQDPVVRGRANPFTQQLVSNTEAVDEFTLLVETEFTADLVLANLLFTGYGAISPNSINEFGNTYVVAEGEDNPGESVYQFPIGTGPYTFEALTPEGMSLSRYEDYWGELPYYGAVDFQFIPEAATRESLILADQVDMTVLPPVSDIQSLQENEEVEMLIAPGNRAIYIAFNTTDEVLSDPLVRQALNHAVDKEAITNDLLFGAATPATSIVSQDAFGYCETGPYEYDPTRATELLEEAGITGDITLNFAAPTGRFLQDFQVAQAVSAYLGVIGVNAVPTTSDYGAYVGSLFLPAEQQTLDMSMFGFAPTGPDAALGMYFVSHNTQITPRGLNTAYYDNAEYSALLDEAFTNSDPEARAEALCEAQEIIWEDAPWLFLHFQDYPIVYDADLEGVTFRVGEKFDAIYARPSDS
jgi:ABC-type transport system substrate-binding protein